MDLNEAQNKIAQFIRELDATRERDTLLFAKEARALIVRRIQNTGKDYRENQLGKYSANPLPLFFFDDILSSSQKKRAQKESKGKGISYKDVRDLAGRRTNFVDLTFTGEMWAGTVAIIESQTPDSVTAVITGKDAETRKKLDYNSRRYGNILRLTQKERAQLERAALDRVGNLFKKYFG